MTRTLHKPSLKRPAATAPRAGDGNTSVATEGSSRPRLPHEHDESADSQVAADNDVKHVIEQAHADLERGLVDTGTGPVIDRTYERVKRGR